MIYPSDFICLDCVRLYAIVLNEMGYANETKTIECGLFNSSYTVDFNFVNGYQNISVCNLTRLNGLTGSPGVHAPEPSKYCSDSVISTWSNPTAPTSSHIAMMAALGRLLNGWLPHMSSIAFGTQITSSVLMDTQEMMNARYSMPDNLPASIANMSLTQALEEVFINATLSLFSDTSFLCVFCPTHQAWILLIIPLILLQPEYKYCINGRDSCLRAAKYVRIPRQESSHRLH